MKIAGNTIQNNRLGIGSNDDLHPITGNAIHFNTISGNSEYGIKNLSDTVALEASNNWWEDTSGPYHAVDNPEGLGDEVTDYVIFSSWSEIPAGEVVVVSPSNPSVEDGENGIAVDTDFGGATDWRVFMGLRFIL